jgi:signal peptidase II
LSRRAIDWLVFFGVAALTLAADRVTKTIVANNLSLYETWDLPVPILSRFLRITYITNTGAAFGLFPDKGLFFIIIAFVVIAAVIFYYRQLPEGYTLARVALGLMLGGAIGNLADRMRQGYVVDFADFNFWPLENWPVWNIADSAIVVGVTLLALTMLLDDLAADHDDEVGSSPSGAAGEHGTSP